MIRLKRVYDPPSTHDGTRVLVERLLPQGVSKERTKIDLWLRVVAPSAELREWFGHDPARWEGFRRRYRAELAVKPGLLHTLREYERDGTHILVYAARDDQQNHAVALKMFLGEEAG
jgi:uncharacterized protein YeaO (DUF488 family)